MFAENFDESGKGFRIDRFLEIAANAVPKYPDDLRTKPSDRRYIDTNRSAFAQRPIALSHESCSRKIQDANGKGAAFPVCHQRVERNLPPFGTPAFCGSDLFDKLVRGNGHPLRLAVGG
jgi:hypothetical protein